MSLIAKPPALVMLAGALWLTAVDLAQAQAETAATKREKFTALVAGPQSQAVSNQVQHLTQIIAQSQRLLHAQNALTAKLTSPPPILVRLSLLDQHLQQLSARILGRLQRLNNLGATGSQNATALARLRKDLTRQEAIVMRGLQTVRRFERAAATPSAPGVF